MKKLLKAMEKKWNTMLLIIISGLLSVITLMGKEYMANEKVKTVETRRITSLILKRMGKSDSLQIELRNDIKWGMELGLEGKKMLDNHEVRIDRIEQKDIVQDQSILRNSR